MPITIRIVPQISIPPIVGVPLFLMWSALKSLADLPSDAVSRICFPMRFFSRKFIKGLAAVRAMRKDSPNEPNISIKWRTVSVIGNNVSIVSSCSMVAVYQL